MSDGRRAAADRRGGEEHSPSPGVLFQMITDNARTQEEDHKRIRKDLEDAVTRFDIAVDRLSSLEAAHASTAAHLVRLQSTPVDVTKVRFPLALVVGLVTTLVGGFIFLGTLGWNFSAKVDAQNKANELAIQGLRSDMAAWRSATDRETAQTAKLTDERSLNIKETISKLDAQMRLQYAEFQTFRQEMARAKR